MRGTYFVTGATGFVGSAVAAELVKSDHRVRGLVRASSVTRVAHGVEPVVGDLNDPDSFSNALDGVGGLFLYSGYDRLEETLSRAAAAGVERVVLLSASSAETGDETNAIGAYHIRSEEMVRASGLDWTFLRPRTFMTNTLQWREQLAEGDIVRAYGNPPVATVDPADVGAVAARTLVEDGHTAASYPLTGPQSISTSDRVDVLAGALQRPLTFEALTAAEARADMTGTMPEPYLEAFLRFPTEGALVEADVHPAVARILGRPANNFAQWCREAAGQFPPLS